MVLIILAGQLVIAVPAAWAFAVYRFPFRRLLFTLYIVLMLMPFQVTMLSSYLVLDRLRLMDTQAAVILPAIFFHFPCVSDLQRVLQHSSRAAGGRKDRRRRRAWAFCKDRASAGLLGNPFRICAGLSGVLEYD